MFTGVMMKMKNVSKDDYASLQGCYMYSYRYFLEGVRPIIVPDNNLGFLCITGYVTRTGLCSLLV